MKIPLKTKADWKNALLDKELVVKHYKYLNEEDKKIRATNTEIRNAKKAKSIEEKNAKKLEKFKANKAKEKAKLETEIKKYGVEDGTKIYNKKIWQGMTQDMLVSSRGKPLDIDETVYKTKTKSNFFYNAYITRQNSTKYKFRVDMENRIVVGWKDLD